MGCKKLMGLNRIVTWRFAEAPAHLRSLHTKAVAPDWVVLVPRALQSSDVEEAIKGGAISVACYDTPDGDLVYMGMTSVSPVPRENVQVVLPSTANAISTTQQEYSEAAETRPPVTSTNT